MFFFMPLLQGPLTKRRPDLSIIAPVGFAARMPVTGPLRRSSKADRIRRLWVSRALKPSSFAIFACLLCPFHLSRRTDSIGSLSPKQSPSGWPSGGTQVHVRSIVPGTLEFVRSMIHVGFFGPNSNSWLSPPSPVTRSSSHSKNEYDQN